MEFRLKFSVKDETCVSSAANFKKARKEKKGVVISLTPRQNSNIYHLKLILFGTKKGKLEINISLYSTLQTIGVFKIFSWCFHCQRWPITSFTTAPNTKKLPLESVFFFSVFIHNDERSYITPSSFFCTLVHPVQNAMLSLSIY